VVTAPVIIDGERLFLLRGVSAFPARERVAGVRERILLVAKDSSVDVDKIAVRTLEDRSTIYAGKIEILNVFDVDAAVESVQRQILAGVYREAIAAAVTRYRHDRSPTVLLRNGAVAVAVTGVLLFLVWGVRAVFRRLDAWAERHVRKSVRGLASKSYHLIRAGTLWSLVTTLLRLVRTAFFLALTYFYLNTVLGLFPWTRPTARALLQLVLTPLKSLGAGLVGALPNLFFLVVLWFVVRYLLRLLRAFFEGVGAERIRLENFDPDWAQPTFKIVRLVVIALAAVIAYPYIPGSDSAAFKGVSVFAGVLLSLGSSSFIANVIAGVSMTYRGAFKIGDWVKVGEVVGAVDEVRLMVTWVRTPKNERVVLPNSRILNSEVVNYSQLAQKDGVVLHTMVGIGYDTPWRQVEAMLLEAAARTEGLKSEPPPFVTQTGLGDFAVNYEINAYSAEVSRMPALYSALHANIQDVFNEHGVQIMSPAYERDPETPKIVPPEKWYEAPAKRPVEE
jgi:small-conductance mechanosensitive channel